MKYLAPVIKIISGYDATEWEVFIHGWQSGLKMKYLAVRRLGGPGDLGRDVVGFVDDKKFDGVWDNYQCKHYRTLLQSTEILVDIAKIVYHSSQGEYTPPRAAYFVTPRGVAKAGLDLLGSPTKLRQEVLTKWDAFLSSQISEATNCSLTPKLKSWIDSYNFGAFDWSKPEDMLGDYRKTGHWAERFDGVLPAALKGVVPPGIGSDESRYIRHLLDAYEDKTGGTFLDHSALGGNPELQSDLNKQRERFFRCGGICPHVP